MKYPTLLQCQTEGCRDIAAAISGAAGLLSDVMSDFEGSDQNTGSWPEHWHPGRIVAVLDLINHAAHGQYLTLARAVGESDE